MKSFLRTGVLLLCSAILIFELYILINFSGEEIPETTKIVETVEIP